MFGATELSGDCAWWQCLETVEKGASVPIGHGIEGVVLHLVDPELLPIEAPEAVGELVVEGPVVALGYADGDRSRFIPAIPGHPATSTGRTPEMDGNA